MDDFDVQGKERELDELLSEVKSLLEEDEPLREDPMEDAGLQDEASEGPMTADDVNIDFEKFYDDAAGFPDEGIYTPPTAYEQSKSAYQVARRAEYERMREAEREARDRQRVARDREEERVMRKLESRNRKTAETVKNPPRSDEEYAQWLYEQGVEPETEEHRELLRQREQEQQRQQPDGLPPVPSCAFHKVPSLITRTRMGQYKTDLRLPSKALASLATSGSVVCAAADSRSARAASYCFSCK